MLDKHHPLPIYYQLQELIREKIADGVWGPGDLIPSERELSEQYNISRMTVRQALNELTNEGIVRREQGRGTFVTEPKLEQRLTKLTGFTEDMRKRGLRTEARVLRLESVQAPVRAAKALQVKSGTPVVLLERLRLANGTPLALETCYLHFSGCDSLLQENLEHQSLYEVLTRKYGLVPSRAYQQIEAGICEPRVMQLLDLHQGSAVLLIRRTTLGQNGQSFEHVVSVYRGDKYVFYAELVP